MKGSLLCGLIVFFCSFVAQADITTKIQTGVWAENSAHDDADILFPLSADVKATGVLSTTKTRYGLDVRVGTPDFFRDDQVASVREGYLEQHIVGGDLQIGRLLMPWGRADQINPTNSLVTRDYQWRTTNDDDQKSGNDGMAWIYELDKWRFTSVWMPHMNSSRVPWVAVLKDVPDDAPDDLFNVAQRVDHSGQQFDWGASIYQGINVMPSLAVTVAPTPSMLWTNYRIRRIGFDAAMNLGKSTIRTELAYTDVLSGNQDSVNILHGQPYDQIQAVLGMDRNLAENLNLNLQLLGQWIPDDYGSESTLPAEVQPLVTMQRLVNQQPVKNLYGISWRLRKTLLQDTLSLEFADIAYGNGQGSLLRPRAEYQIDDHNSVTIGGDRFFGDKDAMMGVLQDDSVWFAQWTFAF